jgi:murein DD-endopeptidase MepM/ murein hydrolase activator NlpD
MKMNRSAFEGILSCLFAICLLFIPLKGWSYVDTPDKDFNADAPWRVQNADTTIPFSVLIKDVWNNDPEELSYIQIVTLHYPGEQEADTVYYRSFDDMEVKCARPPNEISDTEGCINGNWELNIDKFEGTGDPSLEGKPITCRRLGYQAGDDIYFKVQIARKDVLGILVSFSKYLKVHVGEPLPKPGPNWYYGDTHFHTEYTNDPKEYGGQLTAVRDAAKAMGLDFVMTTDHASDLPVAEDDDWQGWFNCWDLCQASWSNLYKRINKTNELNDSNGLPFVQGEEITCQAVDYQAEDGIHLLVYDNNEFISGKIDDKNHPQELLKAKLHTLYTSEESAFAYAAHPMDVFDPVLGPVELPFGGIAKWTDQNYQTALVYDQFIGLEIWNTRKTKKHCPIGTPGDVCPKLNLDIYVNPFNNDGQWSYNVAKWDEKLVAGVEKWDVLMKENVDPLRKIFISGGSDAHGDMNYTIGGLGPLALIDLNDNAMGKVRTLVYAPGGKNRGNILNGFRNGRSVVTDGPVVIFGMDRDQNGGLEANGSDVIIGDHIVLPQTDATTFFIQWNSTDEFGDIHEIEIFRNGDTLMTLELPKDSSPNGKEGSRTWSQNATMVPGTYYYRAEARVKDAEGNIVYRCYTNPIWITYVVVNDCLGAVSSFNWKGEYFNNNELRGVPSMIRDDGPEFLSFDWANGSPGSACGLGMDNFSARFTRSVHFGGGTYRFTVTSDQSFRLFVDGVERLDKDIVQGLTTYTVDTALSTGYHTIKLEYFENGGYATAKLSWKEIFYSGSWAYPVGDPDSGAGWEVTNSLGDSWCFEGGQECYHGHLGEDWFKNSGNSLGEPVYAAAAGKVSTVLQNCGNYVDVVIIKHEMEGFEEPIYSFYGHIEANGYVQIGDWVEKRQQIGVLGDPIDFDPHLHFEIKNHTALVSPPFSNCTDLIYEIYISAGYSHEQNGYDGGDYYDPSNDGVEGNRYYHPSRFIENHKDDGPWPGPDCSAFVRDLTYGDGSAVSPGETISKGWLLSNCGSTTWGTSGGYRAVRISGSYGPTSFNIPTVGPGQTGDLFASITVPTTAGTHRATYKLEGPGGMFGDPFWVEVVVEQDCSKFVEDINYKDGWVLSPGQTINKGWRLSNCGSSTWSTSDGYRAVRISGSYGPTSFNIPTVGPGQTGNLFASITVPTTLGTHRATYKLEGPGGTFGDPFWVEVVVEQDCSKFVEDINYKDGWVLSPGQTIDKGWRLFNCGGTTWDTSSGHRAVRISGSYGPPSFTIPTVGPGQTGDLFASITAPTTLGTHRATYKLEGPGGIFGEAFWVEVVVASDHVVDDGDTGFVRYGPSQYWHRESIGYKGDMYWTYVNGNVVSNKVRWNPVLPGAGDYQVKVFIPYNHATTASAKYKVKANGKTYTKTVNQNNYYDAWVTLGTYYFNASNNKSEYVELTDATGESANSLKKIGFDAVKWSKK